MATFVTTSVSSTASPDAEATTALVSETLSTITTSSALTTSTASTSSEAGAPAPSSEASSVGSLVASAAPTSSTLPESSTVEGTAAPGAPLPSPSPTTASLLTTTSDLTTATDPVASDTVLTTVSTTTTTLGAVEPLQSGTSIGLTTTASTDVSSVVTMTSSPSWDASLLPSDAAGVGATTVPDGSTAAITTASTMLTDTTTASPLSTISSSVVATDLPVPTSLTDIPVATSSTDLLMSTSSTNLPASTSSTSPQAPTSSTDLLVSTSSAGLLGPTSSIDLLAPTSPIDLSVSTSSSPPGASTVPPGESSLLTSSAVTLTTTALGSELAGTTATLATDAPAATRTTATTTVATALPDAAGPAPAAGGVVAGTTGNGTTSIATSALSAITGEALSDSPAVIPSPTTITMTTATVSELMTSSAIAIETTLPSVSSSAVSTGTILTDPTAIAITTTTTTTMATRESDISNATVGVVDTSFPPASGGGGGGGGGGDGGDGVILTISTTNPAHNTAPTAPLVSAVPTTASISVPAATNPELITIVDGTPTTLLASATQVVASTETFWDPVIATTSAQTAASTATVVPATPTISVTNNDLMHDADNVIDDAVGRANSNLVIDDTLLAPSTGLENETAPSGNDAEDAGQSSGLSKLSDLNATITTDGAAAAIMTHDVLPDGSAAVAPGTAGTTATNRDVPTAEVSSQRTNRGAIVGGTIGGLLGLLVFAFAVYSFLRYRRRRHGAKAISVDRSSGGSGTYLARERGDVETGRFSTSSVLGAAAADRDSQLSALSEERVVSIIARTLEGPMPYLTTTTPRPRDPADTRPADEADSPVSLMYLPFATIAEEDEGGEGDEANPLRSMFRSDSTLEPGSTYHVTVGQDQIPGQYPGHEDVPEFAFPSLYSISLTSDSADPDTRSSMESHQTSRGSASHAVSGAHVVGEPATQPVPVAADARGVASSGYAGTSATSGTHHLRSELLTMLLSGPVLASPSPSSLTTALRSPHLTPMTPTMEPSQHHRFTAKTEIMPAGAVGVFAHHEPSALASPTLPPLSAVGMEMPPPLLLAPHSGLLQLAPRLSGLSGSALAFSLLRSSMAGTWTSVVTDGSDSTAHTDDPFALPQV